MNTHFSPLEMSSLSKGSSCTETFQPIQCRNAVALNTRIPEVCHAGDCFPVLCHGDARFVGAEAGVFLG